MSCPRTELVASRMLVPLFALLAGMVQVPAARANQQPFAIYVSPGGNDAWSGQRPAPNPARDDGPCATLARAQTVLRSIRSTEGGRRGATIVIRAGTYYLTAPLSFGAEDSGLPKEPITIQAYPGETVTLSGGRPVTNWRSYKGNVLQADVSAILGAQEGNTPSLPTNPINEGVGDRTLAQRNELFCDGERMELARWPNLSTPVAGGGWAMTAGVPVKGSRTQFYYQGEAPVRWVHPEQAQVHLFGAFDWLDEYRGIASVDTTRHLITLSKPTIFPIAPGHRFYVRNVFEELDAPCEWYLDNHSGTIYFYPPKPSDSTDNVQLSVLSSIVSLKQAHDIVLLGLTMEDVTGAAIYEEGCSRVRIEACEIRNVGKIGVCANASDYCEIEGCQIHDTGSDAILLRCGDRKTLDSSKMVVCNNNIFRFGRLVECYTPGVSISGVGISVTHNLIHDGPHEAILMSGNDHDVSYNDIYNVCLDTSDCGAVYTGADWTFRGNTIRFNKIHDVPGFGYENYDATTHEAVYTSRAAQAIYLDDGASGFDITGNIIYRIGLLGVLVGGGRDNTIAGNIFVDTFGAVGIDARYASTGWARPDHLRHRLADIPYQTPPWSVRYPKLAVPMRQDGWPEGNEISHNIIVTNKQRKPDDKVPWFPSDTMASFEVPSDSVSIDRNLYWNDGRPVNIGYRILDRGSQWENTPLSEWQKSGFDHDALSIDPLFINVSQYDLRLKRKSPAYKLGFPNPPWDQIGLLPGFPDRWRPAVTAVGNTQSPPTVYRYPVDVVPVAQDAR